MHLLRRAFHVPASKLFFSFTKSSGPGGQNVNKLNTKCLLKCDLNGWLPEKLFSAMLLLNSNKINSNRELVIQCDAHRSQVENEKECRNKLQRLFSEAERATLDPTEPSIEQQKRVAGLRSSFKEARKIEKERQKECKSGRRPGTSTAMYRNEDAKALKFVDETMAEVRRNWNVTTQDDYNPIMLAMEMLQQKTGTGAKTVHDYDDFRQLKDKLEQSMNTIIEKYYSGFNNAVSVFGGIVENINSSKSEVQTMRLELEGFRDQIQYKRTDLPELYSKIGVYKEAVQAGRKVFELSANRTKYIELAGEKFFIPAAKLLFQNQEILSQYKIDSGDAYKAVLLEDKKHICAQIFDELIQHAFLKKKNASIQWINKAYQEIPDLQSKIGQLSDDYALNYMEIPVYSEDDLVIAPAEFEFKPDSNSFVYLSSLLHALHILGSLEDSLETIEQRISAELYYLVEGEIKVAAEKLRKSRPIPELADCYVVIPTNMDSMSRDEFLAFCPILREVVKIVTVKLLAIANIFKFISKAIMNLKSNDEIFAGIQSPLEFASLSIFREFKNFVSSLIYSNSSPTEGFSDPLSEITDILRNSKQKVTIDKSNLFTFALSIGENTVSDIKSMAIVIKDNDKILARNVAFSLNIDPYSNSKNDLGHRQITKPNIQYLMVVFNYIVALDQIVKSILPESTPISSILPFFEGAVEKEYVPFVESYMLHDLVASFKGSDGSSWADFSTDSFKYEVAVGKSSSSVLRSYLTFVRLTSECCRLIYFFPSYQESFERIMEHLFDHMLDKSEIKLRDLVLSRFSVDEDPSSNLLCFSVQLAKNLEIRSILMQNALLANSSDKQLNRLLSEKEALVMERLKGDRSIGRNELIIDPRTIRDLAVLQRSFERLQSLIMDGRYVVDQNYRSMTKFVVNEERVLYLHVFEDGRKSLFKLNSSFDAKFTVFCDLLEKLAQTCLLTIHCEMRAHAFYFLDLAFREGSYHLDLPILSEPDPYVLNWASDLVNMSNALIDWFPTSKYLFLFDGLGILIDSILVNNFQYIKSINSAGCDKLTTNTTAIIQILTQILPPSEVNLYRSNEYYRLTRIPCAQLISEIQNSSIKFTYMQYKALLDVAYADAFREDDFVLRKTYANHLTILKYMTEEPKSPNDSARED